MKIIKKHRCRCGRAEQQYCTNNYPGINATRCGYCNYDMFYTAIIRLLDSSVLLRRFQAETEAEEWYKKMERYVKEYNIRIRKKKRGYS